jgi:glycosyltransferase involved in cell wall biosynthesis
MYLADGDSVLVADEPADFARAVIRLYRDPDLWQRLSRGGLRVMEEHFSFEAARRVLTDLVGEPG